VANDREDDALAETVTPEPALGATLPASMHGETQSASVVGNMAGATELPIVEATSYDLGAELGRGGMGRVLVAKDRRLDRILAIKVSRSKDPTSRTRFAREALLTARLQHPSIVPVHEAGTWATSGEPFYAMKMVDGRSLEALIAKTTTLDERLALVPNVIAVVDALAFAHAKRIIHRDLKPSNVIVGDYGETIVIDWGLAKELDDERELPGPYRASGGGETVEGSAMGTPPYMSPEQADGERVDERADVYGLGAMLYHVLCGEPPYRGSDAGAVMAQVLAGPPAPLAERMPGIPRDLLTIIDKAMARDKAERYPNAGPLGEDLKRFFRGQLVAAHAYSTWELVARWLRKHRTIVSVIALAVLVLVLGGVVSVTRIMSERNAANVASAKATASAHRLVIETGRSELELGHHAKAAAALAQAYAAGDRDPATRLMLAAAMRPLDAEVARYDAGMRVELLAFTADGSALVAMGDRAMVWDVASGKSQVLDIGQARPTDVAVFGTRAAVALGDGTAKVFDTKTGRLLVELEGVHEHVRRVRFSPDGTRIVTSSGVGGVVALWNAADGTLIAQRDLGEAAMTFVTGEELLRVDTDGTFTTDVIADPRERELAITRFKSGFEPRVAFFPDGRFVTAARSGQIVIWSPAGEPLGLLVAPSGHVISELGVSAERIAIGGNGFAMLFSRYYTKDGWVPLGSRRPGRIAQPLAVDPEQSISGIAISDRLLALGDDRAVRTFDAFGGSQLATRPSEGQVHTLVFAGEARLVSVGTARVAEISDAHGDPVWRLEGAMHTAAIARNRLATAGFGNEIRIWNLDAEPARAIAHNPTPTVPSFAPDGRLALVDEGRVRLGAATFGEEVHAVTFMSDAQTILTTHGDWRPRLWRTDGTLVRALERGSSSYSQIASLPGGTRWIATSPPGALRAVLQIWDLASGKLVEKLNAHPSKFAPTTGGSRYATFGGDDVAIWDAATNVQVARFDIASHYAALSPDGARIAIGKHDGATELYDIATKQLVTTLAGHVAEVTYIDYTAAHIVTASADGTARIWTGDHSITLAGHRGEITCVRLSPDGTLVATGGDDGTLRIWDVRDGRQLLAYDNGAEVFAVGFSPASDAAYATTTTDPAIMRGGGRVALWRLDYESRTAADVQRVIDATR
jgi:WD40 repeat protein